MPKANGAQTGICLAGMAIALWLSEIQSHAKQGLEEPSDLPDVSISLNHATNLAIDHHPEIKKIRWLTAKTDAVGFQESRLTNPQIGSVVTEIGNAGQAGQYGFFLQRNLVRNNRVDQIQNSFRWRLKSWDAINRLAQRKIAYEVARNFIEVGFLRQKIDLANRQVEELEHIDKIAQSLMAGGELGQYDLNLFAIEVMAARQKTEVLKLELAGSLANLQKYIGSSTEVDPGFDFAKEVALVLDSDLKRSAVIDEHPAVVHWTNRIEAQRWQVRVAQSMQLPDWQLQTSVNFDTEADTFFGGFQFNVPWQINDRKQGLISSESAGLKILVENQNQTRWNLERKMVRLEQRRKMLVYEIQSINNSILPKMDEIKNQTIRLFRAGETELMNVKTAITKSIQWQQKKMNLAQDLLLVEAETETLPLDESSSPLD